MGRRKTIVIIAVVAALTLAIAGSAFAVAATSPGGYQGDKAVGATATTAAQYGDGPQAQNGDGPQAVNGAAQGPNTTCTDCGDQDQVRERTRTTERLQDGTGGGTPDQTRTTERTQNGSSAGDCDQTRTTERLQDGTCSGDCDGTPDQTRTQEQLQDGTCDGDGNGPAYGDGACQGDSGGNGPDGQGGHGGGR